MKDNIVTSMEGFLKVQTASSMNFHNQRHTAKDVIVSVEGINECLIAELGAETFAVYCAIMANWNREEGLPTVDEIIKMTGLSETEIVGAVKTLLSIKIDSERYLFNRDLLNKRINKDMDDLFIRLL